MAYEQILKNIRDQGIHLTQAQQELFVSLLVPGKIKKKESILEIGSVCRYDVFVNKGCFKICYYDTKGVECILKFAPENYWLVDLDSFLSARPSFYFFQAVEDSEILQLPKSAHDLLHLKIPALHEFSHKRWQAGFTALQHRLLQSHSLPAEERYRQFKKKYPGLEKRIPQKMIAAYIGVTPQFLSSIKKRK